MINFDPKQFGQSCTQAERQSFETESYSSLTVRHFTVIPWCGLKINGATLETTVDYARYADTNMVDTLTVEYVRKPGQALQQKLLQFAFRFIVKAFN